MKIFSVILAKRGAHNLSEVEGGTETGNGGTVDTDTDMDRKATTQRTE